MESPPKRSCCVVSPCNPLSVWSVGPQIALGTDAGNPSEEIACAEAIAAPSNRPGNAAVATANNFTSSCLFIIPPCHVSALPASVAHIGRSTRFSSEELQTQFGCDGAVRKKRSYSTSTRLAGSAAAIHFLAKMFQKRRIVGLRIRVRARVERTNNQGSWEIAQRSMSRGAAGDARTRTCPAAGRRYPHYKLPRHRLQCVYRDGNADD